MLSKDDMMMQLALGQARKAFDQDEVPVGAVITHQDQVIAKSHNQVELLKDPTAHAEMIAITQASNHLQSKWLYDCTLYVTLEPCSMCAGALVLARIKRIVFGAKEPKCGACGSVYNIVSDQKLNHQIEVVSGVKELECAGIMQEFFELKRKSK